jgi:DNA-binding MarR family transcriptional regulator
MVSQAPVAIGRDYRVSVLAWMHLARVHSRIVREEHSLLTGRGLTRAQFDALAHLAANPGLSQQELADRLLVTKGNICGLIDRLESAGLVERRADPEDRRAHLLHLTGAGECAVQATAPALEATITRQMDALSDDEQNTLMSLLAKLDRALRHQQG